MTLNKLSCAAFAAVSLMAGQALAQEAAAPAPAPAPAPAEQAVPAPAPAPAPTEQAAPATEAAPAAAPAATAAAVSELGKPAAGKGQIVFYRPSKFAGMAISFKVREGETELGKLGNGNFFFIDVEPGSHEYVVHSEVKDVLPLEVDAGEVYYVQGTLGLGVMVGRPNLSPADKAKFESAGKLKQSKL